MTCMTHEGHDPSREPSDAEQALLDTPDDLLDDDELAVLDYLDALDPQLDGDESDDAPLLDDDESDDADGRL